MSVVDFGDLANKCLIALLEHIATNKNSKHVQGTIANFWWKIIDIKAGVMQN